MEEDLPQVGDIVFFEARKDSELYPGIECIIVEMKEDGNIGKMKALVPNPILGKIGFFLEGEDYVSFPYDIINKN